MTEPGWYPDASSPGVERWWDGIDWTEFTRAPVTVEPARRPGQRNPEVRVVHVRESTGAALAISLSPTWFGMLIFALTAFAVASPLAGAVLGAVPVAAALALFVLAGSDREQLRARGARDAASPLWMFLSPLGYLIARWAALRPYGAGGEGWIWLCVAQLLVLLLITGWWSGVAGLLTFG